MTKKEIGVILKELRQQSEKTQQQVKSPKKAVYNKVYKKTSLRLVGVLKKLFCEGGA